MWEAFQARVVDAIKGKPWDDGVPGRWITGDRMADVVLLPPLFAFGFVLLRRVLVSFLFEPSGVAVMTRRMKKSGSKWDVPKQAEFLRKWNESCWKCFIYTVFTTFAFLATCTEPYFTNPQQFWAGATQVPLNYYVPLKHALFYHIQIGFYLQAVPFLMFIEVRRKDWAESFAHHIVTLGLMYYSYYVNFTRPGVIVMLLHDVSDIFLEAAKLSRYAGRQSAATAWFAAFALSWIVLRVVIFCRVIVLSCMIDPIVMIALPYDVDPQPHYSIFATLFMVLYFLHLYWTWLILQVVRKQLTGGTASDVREDDDSDDG
ncbi:LAG1 longevity assurance [Raphidocelis subcapitata]|uniref:LAG1 longevity assurance n=1 Tax=Raphidocelis subcapitata TaxID=307507 RepID=A0A2V0NXZ9_9CHLO|nr:LAG1 longevity assurance [Raphidocelis subcapitata]|eukprot:GBF89705.1 LAG1 longevity assurance [Raphidocelis subcapitata]